MRNKRYGMHNRIIHHRAIRNRGLWGFLMGFVMLMIVFIYATKNDMNAAKRMLETNVSYVKEQCNRYARIDLAEETKSLMRLMESSKQISSQIQENDGVCTEEALENYADNSYVSGIVILDADGTIQAAYHDEGKAPEPLSAALKSTALLNTASYPEKRYAVRLRCSDNSEVDVAASVRTDKKGIVVAYYHTPLEYIESFNLSISTLLAGYDVDKNGTIVVSEGNTITASNDAELIGLDTDDIPILHSLKSAPQENGLMHTNKQEHSISQYFGLMERGRDFYVYNYLPERTVFTGTPRMLMYTLIIYIVVYILAVATRWRVAQQYREKQMEAQRDYAIKLQDKNEQLSAAVDQADRANAAKSNFLSRMSHDIRTPLNGIIGLLEICEKHPEDMKLIQESQKKMRISANHLLSLINDVLQMSKLESGEIIIPHEPLDLYKLSEEVLTIISQRAAESGITMTYDNSVDADNAARFRWVYGSELHLRQVFLNIYTNCIKYNKIGGKILTRAECAVTENDTVTYRWTISDTGIGMSKEFLDHIFDPFTQERSDARSVYQGTGLGMAIVKGLVEKMNGVIEITSIEGEGSTFIITLPFELAEAPQNMCSSEKMDEANDLHGVHLLLAEDNELNAEIARTLLEDEGAEVVIVGNGEQAVELFQNNPPETFDAILMDIMMPLMDGLTATKIIRDLERPDAKRIPIIAMTANAFEEDVCKCMDAGMNAHTAKPLQLETLKRTIQEQIHKSKS